MIADLRTPVARAIQQKSSGMAVERPSEHDRKRPEQINHFLYRP